MKNILISIKEKVKKSIAIPGYYNSSIEGTTYSSVNELIQSITDRRADLDLMKKKYPVRYFLSETVPDNLYNSKRNIRNLWHKVKHHTTERYDILKMPTVEKAYHDKDYLMLHAVFTFIVDYVEIECANQQGQKRKKRSRYLGLQHLDWEINSTAPPQSDNAMVIKELYLWWKDCYLERENYNIPTLIGQESFLASEEDIMLEKAISVRGALWT